MKPSWATTPGASPDPLITDLALSTALPRAGTLPAWRKVALTVALWALAALLLVWVFGAIPFADVWMILRRLGEAQIALLLALNGLIAFSFGWRWALILRAQGYTLPYPILASYRLVAYSISYFTPGPHFGGEPLQVYLAARRGVPGSVAAASVGLDKLLELAVNFSFLLLGVIVTAGTQLGRDVPGPALIALALLLLALPLGFLWALSRGVHPFSRALARLARWIPALARAYSPVKEVEAHAAALCRNRPALLILAFMGSALVWAAMMFEYWLAAAFLGLNLSLVPLLSLVTASRIAILLPSPGGLGTLEASQVWMAGQLGLDPAAGLGLSLLIRARDVLFGLLGLAWGAITVGGWRILWNTQGHSMNNNGIRRMEAARIPTAMGEFQLYLYLSSKDSKEHLALVMGDVRGRREVLVRVHSECLTGDMLGSRRCDCGEQLAASKRMIADEGVGVLIYLRQEGRGIGLLDKLRAYNLQDQGYDTVDANLILGHQADEREYSAAAYILRDLGVRSLRLLTNNPQKIESLRAFGLQITRRIPLVVGVTPENAGYLHTKAERLNHVLEVPSALGPFSFQTLNPSGGNGDSP